jgi:hypothetical protein
MSDSVSTSTPPTPPTLERWTGYIKAIGTILVAIAGLLAAMKAVNTNWSELWKEWRPEVSKPVVPPPSPVAARCLRVSGGEFPSEVRFGDWTKENLRLKGRSTCAEQSGLYVVFLAGGATNPTLRLKVPFDDIPGCQGKYPASEARCWTNKIPINPGDFDFTVAPPNFDLSFVNPGPIEKFRLAWEVREIDSPAKPALAADEVVVSLRNDP